MDRHERSRPPPDFRVYSDVSDFILKGNGIEKKYVETPLMKQYYAVKAVHPDAILLFRVGDFYETSAMMRSSQRNSGHHPDATCQRSRDIRRTGRVSLSCDRHLPTSWSERANAWRSANSSRTPNR